MRRSLSSPWDEGMCSRACTRTEMELLGANT